MYIEFILLLCYYWIIIIGKTQTYFLSDLFEFETIFEKEKPKQLVVYPSIHQQEDGTILAMCITETCTKDSLIAWIRCLQEANPCLEKMSIVFRLVTPDNSFLVPTSDSVELDEQNKQDESTSREEKSRKNEDSS